MCWVAPARMDAINIIKAEMEGKKRQLSELAQAGGRGAEEGGPGAQEEVPDEGTSAPARGAPTPLPSRRFSRTHCARREDQ